MPGPEPGGNRVLIPPSEFAWDVPSSFRTGRPSLMMVPSGSVRMNSVAWCTIAGLFVRTCIFCIQTSVGNGDFTKYESCGISPVGGTCASIGRSITASGCPNAQPPAGNVGAAGRSLSSPFGAPPSAHRTIVSMSFCERLRSFAIFMLAGLRRPMAASRGPPPCS